MASSGWNVRRATGPGIVSGILAFFLWPLFVSFPQLALYPFVATLLLACFCGLSILVFTIIDLRNHRRGRRIRPIRAFDVILGLVLAAPSAVELSVLLR